MDALVIVAVVFSIVFTAQAFTIRAREGRKKLPLFLRIFLPSLLITPAYNALCIISGMQNVWFEDPWIIALVLLVGVQQLLLRYRPSYFLDITKSEMFYAMAGGWLSHATVVVLFYIYSLYAEGVH